MNNQVKLELNREQVVEFLKTARADLTEDDWKDADVITVLQWALPTYQKWTNYGTWNDTPPVPTIKPGDKVRYTLPDSMGEGKVISMIRGIDEIIGAMCLFDTGIYNIPLEYLEVVE